jgi:hypothetical protein
LSRLLLVDLLDEFVEDGGAFGLAVFLGVVALALEGGPELDGGLEVAAGFAGGFHAAVELDDLPRAFRTADLWLIHAADCCSRYSSWTCCGVRY